MEDLLGSNFNERLMNLSSARMLHMGITVLITMLKEVDHTLSYFRLPQGKKKSRLFRTGFSFQILLMLLNNQLNLLRLIARP